MLACRILPGSPLLRSISAVFLLAVLGACGGSTEPEAGRLRVVLSQTGSGLSASLMMAGEIAGSASAGVPLEIVESILVTVVSVRVHRVGGEEEDEEVATGEGASGQGASGESDEGEGGTDDAEDGNGDSPWIDVLLSAPTTVNLVGMSPQEIANGDVPAGTYNQLRLVFEAATITFSEPITVGNITYDAGIGHQLRIPSGDQNGLKVQTSFDVAGGEMETVGLIVDLANSVKNVTATGANRVQMTPVIIGTVGGATI